MILKGKLPRQNSNRQAVVADARPDAAARPRAQRLPAWNRFRVPALAAAILACVFLAGGIFSTTPPPESTVLNYLDVNVVPALPQTHYQVQRNYLGQLESARNSKIGFELAGKLVSVFVDEGDLVRQGQVLADLDTELLRSQFERLTASMDNAQAVLDELIAGPRQEDIATASADVARWTAQLKLAQISRNRMVQLQQSSSVSKQETDESVYDEQSVAAQLDAAKSRLQELENGTRSEQIAAQRAAINQLKAERNTIAIQIRKSQLLAPYDGIVAERFLDEGEVIRVGQPVLGVLDIGRIEARIGVPVELVQSILSQKHQKLVHGGTELLVELKSVRPEKNRDTRTVDLVFQLPKQSISPSIGDTVRMQISQQVDADGFWIPSTALVETYRGLWGCYVAQHTESDSELASTALRELELLHQEGERSFVRGSLQAGESVIFSGIHRLVNGQLVRVHVPQSNSVASAVDSKVY